MDYSHPGRLSRPPGAATQIDGFAMPGDARIEIADATPPTAPPIRRGTMVPRPWQGVWHGIRLGLSSRLRRSHRDRPLRFAPWERAAARRRQTLLALVGLSALGAATLLTRSQLMFDHPVLRAGQLVLFTLLFAWVAAGFFTAMMGFLVQLRGDPHRLSHAALADQPIRADSRTAIIMPICNERIATVFAGLRATCESLLTTGEGRRFDVYVLSDSSDPALRTAELAAWAELRAAVGPGIRIYYRWRQRRTRRKAGNVADFCRRWGRNYRYMVVLDADSVMSGDCLVSLVRMMDAHPDAGIIQTAPQACGLTTLHARAQQFASRITGRLFTAGMQYWQLGESHYWGHNAILRVEPFMQHCALARLPGEGGLSGDILSHDFVEAALMRRAGYHVWLVPDLPGSYEQQPPNLLEELQRDRRWCQGNLQNARLIAEPGLHPVHRAMLATGAMAYLSAPLWLAFLLLGAVLWQRGGHPLFDRDNGLSVGMLALWICTMTMLALPRLLGVLTPLLRGEQHLYGGAFALLKGCLLEATLSMLQAPVRMLAHSAFVLGALTGLKLDWKSPPREAASISWADSMRRFAPVGALAGLLLLGALAIDGSMALWLSPVGIPLLLAIPMTVLTSQPRLGERIRASGLLLIPEESWTPSVLRHAWRYARCTPSAPAWRDVLSDPWLFDVVSRSMGVRRLAHGVRGRERRRLLQRLTVFHGNSTMAERMRLLSEPQHLSLLRDRQPCAMELPLPRRMPG